MEWNINRPTKTGLEPAFWRTGAALLFCAAFWGGLCDLASLSTLGLSALLPGFVLLGLTALIPSKKLLWSCLLLTGTAVVLWTALRFSSIKDGFLVLLNRLFLNSEAKQRYLYEKFSVSAAPELLNALFLPFGLLSGAVFGLCARNSSRAAFVVFGVLLLCLAAWLGLSPNPIWMLLLLLSFLAAMSAPRFHLPISLRLLPLLLALIIGCSYLLLDPGEQNQVRRLSEAARDRLALQTMAYGQREETQAEPEAPVQETRPYTLEPHSAEDPGEAFSFKKLLPLLVILLTLLLLFVPAVWSDSLRRRRLKNRAGLEAEAPEERCHAALLYALRWLTECGMEEQNQPISAYFPAVSEMDAELGAQFSALLPQWQELSYREHPLEPCDEAAFQAFLESAKALSLHRMNWKQRLRVKYVTGL